MRLSWIKASSDWVWTRRTEGEITAAILNSMHAYNQIQNTSLRNRKSGLWAQTRKLANSHESKRVGRRNSAISQKGAVRHRRFSFVFRKGKELWGFIDKSVETRSKWLDRMLNSGARWVPRHSFRSEYIISQLSRPPNRNTPAEKLDTKILCKHSPGEPSTSWQVNSPELLVKGNFHPIRQLHWRLNE